jgi:K+ transporter
MAQPRWCAVVLHRFGSTICCEFLQHDVPAVRKSNTDNQYQDLGAFSRQAIQISWIAWCLPLLLLTYSGQAAYISVHPEAYAYPVFYTAPKGTLIPTMILAVLAAVVASQAIITATFQLIAQITKLSYFPSIKIVHTSCSTTSFTSLSPIGCL